MATLVPGRMYTFTTMAVAFPTFVLNRGESSEDLPSGTPWMLLAKESDDVLKILTPVGIRFVFTNADPHRKIHRWS